MLNVKDYKTMEKAYYDDNYKCVIFKFAGRPNLSEFKEVAMSGLDLLKKSKSGKLLNDTSELEINNVENQEWTQTYWFPEAEKAGLKYFAFVKSKHIFGEASAEQTNEVAEAEGKIKIRYFKTLEEAGNWLKSC